MQTLVRRGALAFGLALLFSAVAFTGAAASTKDHGNGGQNHGNAGRGNTKSGAPTITSAPFGTANGQAVSLYTLTNSNGMVVKIMTYAGGVQGDPDPDKRHPVNDGRLELRH